MVTQATDTPSASAPAAPIALRDKWRRPVSIGIVFVLFIWSVVELVNLAVVHTVGPEIYGVLVAFLAVVASALSLVLLVRAKRQVFGAIAVIALWAIVGLGGIAGAYYHAVGVDPKYGVVDSRPRPAGSPLIFLAFGLAGFSAIYYGQRLSAVRLAG